MKNLLIHGVYLSVIVVISILFFLKIKSYDKFFLKSNEALEHDFLTIERQSEIILDELDYRVKARPRFSQYFNIAKITIKVAANIDSFIQTLTPKTALTNAEYVELRKQMKDVREIFIALVPNPADKKKLSYLIPLDTSKNGYSFDSKVSIKFELNAIKNEISKSKLAVLNYCLYNTTHRGVIECGPNYRLAFYPKKGVLIEGERMEAEVAVVEFSKQYNAFRIEVNHRPYSLKDGIVVFKDNIQRKVGEHKIETSAMIKDVLTNDTIQIRGEYNYSVLPKCSRDCGKNQ
jgi:hypothetical protein